MTSGELRRYGPALGLVGLLGMLLGIGHALFLATPMYRSSAQVLVGGALPAGFGAGGPTRKAVNVGTERELFASAEVVRRVKGALRSPLSLERLRARMGVSVVGGGTEVLAVSFSDGSPAGAQFGAQAYAEAYLGHKQEQVEAARQGQRLAVEAELRRIDDDAAAVRVELGRAASGSAAQAAALAELDALEAAAEPYRRHVAEGSAHPGDVGTVVSAAALPGAPASPRAGLNAVAGAAAGVLVGAGLLLVRDRVDRRLGGRADLERRLRAPVLATVPRTVRGRRAPDTLVSVDLPDSPASDAYRRLRTRLLLLARERRLRTLLVASAHGEGGATAVAANLAVSLARVGRRVTLLAGEHPAQLLRTGEIQGVLATATSTPAGADAGPPAADFVVIESPPVLDSAEGLALAHLVDAVLVVADARQTSRDEIDLIRQELHQVGGDVVGAVLSNF